MSKWSFADGTLTDILFTTTTSFSILKFLMTHKYTMNWILSRTFLTEESIHNLTLEVNTYASFVLIVLLLLKIGCLRH